MSRTKLTITELSKCITNMQEELHQPTYNGRPDEDITTFIDTIEGNSQRLDIPRVQWVDVALYFMDEIVQKVMQKYKENILESDQTNDDNLWDVFKSVLKGLHGRPLQVLCKGASDWAYHRADNAVQQCKCSFRTFRSPELTTQLFLVSNGDGRQNPNSNLFLEVAARGVAVSGVTYTVGPAVILAALNAVGFTSSGVAASMFFSPYLMWTARRIVFSASAAAGVQSVIYGGGTTGAFSVLQSIAAKGVVVSAPVLGLTAGVVGLAAAGIHYVRNRWRWC